MHNSVPLPAAPPDADLQVQGVAKPQLACALQNLFQERLVHWLLHQHPRAVRAHLSESPPPRLDLAAGVGVCADEKGIRTWPLEKKLARTAASAAASRLASANTSKGDFPPSSRVTCEHHPAVAQRPARSRYPLGRYRTRLKLSAQARLTFRPVGMDPVKETCRRASALGCGSPASPPPLSHPSIPPPYLPMAPWQCPGADRAELQRCPSRAQR
jgi:hypothetical protein